MPAGSHGASIRKPTRWTAIISTPFHGYWKNLALALTNKMDWHYTALWDHGHIKFFSPRTLTRLLTDCGFVDVTVKRPDLFPMFACSMVVAFVRPLTTRNGSFPRNE